MPTVDDVRQDFPILHQEIDGKPLCYLDSAATTQKPRQVIEAMTRYYEEYNSNVHRSIHALGERATAAYEEAHEKAARFVNAREWQEMVFTKNCTEAINLVAYAWARRRLNEGDNVVVSRLEHHSNFVPWQQLTRERGAELRIADVTPEGRIPVESFEGLIDDRTCIVSVTGMSNVLGTIPDVKTITRLAHDHGAKVLVDGAQSVPHTRVDVQDLDCDWLAFSGHKMLAPTGIGVLYGKREVLNEMEPFLYGGEMILRVSDDRSTWNDLPWKFEAGTPVIAEGVGLGAAIDYLENLGMEWIEHHERDLTQYALKRLAEVEGLTVYGPPAEERGGVASFTMDEIHAHDLASLMNDAGVAIRAGHHCAQPLMTFLGVPSTARASFYVYSKREEVDTLVAALERAREVFGLA